MEWFPSPTPPLRYFDRRRGACVTIQGSDLQKVTLAEDPAGLPYVNPKGRAFVPCDRAAAAINEGIVLKDHNVETVLETALPPNVHRDAAVPAPSISAIDWRSVFVGGMPRIDPQEAYGAVLLYPEDETPIGEVAAQPFVADYLEDLAEGDRQIGRLLAQANHVLIRNGDAVIASCVAFDRPRDYTVVVREPAFAQKQAQQLWATCAQLRRWEWLKRIRFVLMESSEDRISPQAFDLAYQWMPAGPDAQLLPALAELRGALKPGGYAFVTGPGALRASWKASGFMLVWQEAVDQLPAFRMHRTILPKARLAGDLTLHFVQAG